MFLQSSIALAILTCVASLASGFITFDDIRALTNITNDCLNEIVDPGIPWALQSNAQIQLSKGYDDEVEDAVASALRFLDAYLLEMLNKPNTASNTAPQSSCAKIVQDYHTFIASTVLFLRALDEKQQAFLWRGDSPVFHALGWLQSLWASRKVNEQHLSFIEQQLDLYQPSGCFEKHNEVLGTDVEIVEYMNNLIDSFQ